MLKGVINVTDSTTAKKEVPETEKSPDLPKSTSIYGSDITKVLTSRLVDKAISIENLQFWTLKGIGYELDPIIVVVNKGIKTRLYFDLTKFDKSEGDFLLTNIQSGDNVASFKGKKNIISIDYTFKESGCYAIIKDNTPIGIIEVVNNIKDADLEIIRAKYIK